MKTNYLLALAASLLLAGCAENEMTLESPDVNPPVSFDVYTGVQSRSAETVLTTVQGTGFGIFGYYTGQSNWASTGTPNYMFNQKATYSSSAWSYTPVKYWPNKSGDKVTFFAYAPYSTTSGSGITTNAKSYSGNPYLDFTLAVAANASKTIDLVTASAVNQIKTSSAVGFTFNHVLSRAKFFAKASENLSSGSHVFVKAVRILGSSRNSDSKFYTKARYTFSADTWDYTTGNITIPAADYDMANILNTDAQTGMGGYTAASVDVTGTSPTELFDTSDYFFFIPVANATGTAANDVKVEIDYDIVTVDSQLNAGHTVASNTAQVSLPAGTLKKGTAYNFNFTISMTKISVTAATVNGWTPTPPTDSNVMFP